MASLLTIKASQCTPLSTATPQSTRITTQRSTMSSQFVKATKSTELLQNRLSFAASVSKSLVHMSGSIPKNRKTIGVTATPSNTPASILTKRSMSQVLEEVSVPVQEKAALLTSTMDAANSSIVKKTKTELDQMPVTSNPFLDVKRPLADKAQSRTPVKHHYNKSFHSAPHQWEIKSAQKTVPLRKVLKSSASTTMKPLASDAGNLKFQLFENVLAELGTFSYNV